MGYPEGKVRQSAWLDAAKEYPDGRIPGIKGTLKFIWGKLAFKRKRIDSEFRPIRQSIGYARRAFDKLSSDSAFASRVSEDTDVLRKEIPEATNSQMDVVLALCLEKLFAIRH
jgi:hypothetical protein